MMTDLDPNELAAVDGGVLPALAGAAACFATLWCPFVAGALIGFGAVYAYMT